MLPRPSPKPSTGDETGCVRQPQDFIRQHSTGVSNASLLSLTDYMFSVEVLTPQWPNSLSAFA